MDGPKWRGPGGYYYRRSQLTFEMLRFVERRYDGPEGPEQDFRAERLHATIEEVRDELRHSRHVLEDTGYYGVVDKHFSEIIAGMTIEHMLQEEFALMKSLGSCNPDRDLRGMMYMLRTRYADPKQDFRPVKDSLDQGSNRLDQAVEDTNSDTTPQEVSRPRRWWKGCGQIAQGCIFSVANVGIALDALDLPVSDETRTWGSIVSVTTGVGLIMSGVGDLRGE